MSAKGDQLAIERWREHHRVDVSRLAPEDIIGIGHVTAEVRGLVARLRDPVPAERRGVENPRGILFDGEPGLGKTLVARSVARALGDSAPFAPFRARAMQPPANGLVPIAADADV